MVKRILSCALAILLVLGMVGCSSNNNDNSSTGKDNQTNETNSEKVNEYGIKESDMQDLYATIKSDMLAYFKEKGIDPQTFEWPEKETEEQWYNPDNTYKLNWGLLQMELNRFQGYEDNEVKDFKKDFENSTTYKEQESNQKEVMLKICFSIVDWVLEKHPDMRQTNQWDQIPWQDLLPENIDFSK